MSDETSGPDSLVESRRNRAASARLAAPDWVFSAVIHLLLVMVLVTSKAGPGGGFGAGSGEDGDGGDGSGESLGDRWIEIQMGFDSGSSPPPALLNPGVFETADPLDLPVVTTPSQNEAAEQPPAEILQTGHVVPTDEGRIPPPVAPAEQLADSSFSGSATSGGAGPGNGQGQGSGGGDGSPGEGGDGQGGTSLFGIWDRGERIVYVIDRSSSMQHYGKLDAARGELQSSLARLEASIEFQVLLYNQQVQPLNVRGSQGLIRATVANKNLILRQSQMVLPEGGTQHVAALQAALRLKPTVVYFLTDAEAPGLTATQISATAGQLAGATRIHCIQFGEIPGAGPTAGNWLQQLAQATGGKYVHVRTDALRKADGESQTTR